MVIGFAKVGVVDFQDIHLLICRQLRLEGSRTGLILAFRTGFLKYSINLRMAAVWPQVDYCFGHSIHT